MNLWTSRYWNTLLQRECNWTSIPTIHLGESVILSDQKVIAYLESPQMFQTGFHNYPGVAGMESSLRYILRLGITDIRKKEYKNN
jgi:selenocysteine lyase/cysteine desulfurase